MLAVCVTGSVELSPSHPAAPESPLDTITLMPSAAAAENSVSRTLTPCCPAFASQSPTRDAHHRIHAAAHSHTPPPYRSRSPSSSHHSPPDSHPAHPAPVPITRSVHPASPHPDCHRCSFPDRSRPSAQQHSAALSAVPSCSAYWLMSVATTRDRPTIAMRLLLARHRRARFPPLHIDPRS